MNNKQASKQTKKNVVLLTFLKKTKEGEYAKIEQSSIKYSRLPEKSEMPTAPQDTYFFSFR